MEKTRKFQIVYAGPKNLCEHSTADLARGNNDERTLSKARSFKHSKLQAAFCIQLLFHQRAGKTSLFHMRGGGVTHFNTCCTFNNPQSNVLIHTFLKQLGS